MNASGNENTVFIEMDRISDLREAYPNYFLDVAVFTYGLQRVLSGYEFRIPEYTFAAASDVGDPRALEHAWINQYITRPKRGR